MCKKNVILIHEISKRSPPTPSPARSLRSLALAPRWKFLAMPVVMIKCEVVRLKKLYKLYNYVNYIIMILTTVIRNIYIIFIPWVKQSFPNYEDFSNQRNIPKVCMKSYDRKHQNQKAPYRGREKPLSHPPPPLYTNTSSTGKWSENELNCCRQPQLLNGNSHHAQAWYHCGAIFG